MTAQDGFVIHMRQFIVEAFILSALMRARGDLKPRAVLRCALMLATFAQWMPPGVARAADLPAGEADRSQPWQVTSYGNEAGLSQQRAFDIAFTPDGTVWTACSDGLRRFDGYEWSRFDTNDGLPSSFVRALCVDNLGRLWVGSDSGAGVWDLRRHIYDPLGSQSGMANANVREIDQDPDGTLWFSCDQWPQTTGKPGGLTSLTPGTPGRWTTYYMSNGVPMDNVIGYFRDSGGRQFVLTPNAWGQRRAGQWGVPADPGYQAEDRVLQMAEAKDGTLFAQGEYTLLTLANGRWQDHPGSRTRLLCATRTGQMAAVECNSARGQFWFSLWNGTQFVRASAPVSYPTGTGARFYHLRQAPDGSLWCVGSGILARWEIDAQKWTFFPQPPPPVGTDIQGRVWFADDSGVALNADGHFQTLAPGKYMGWTDLGQVLIWDESRKQLMATDPKNPALRTVVETGCDVIHFVIPGTNGVFWILGQDKKGNGTVAHYDKGRTTILTPREFDGQELSSGVCYPGGQVLVVTHQRDNNLFGLARVGDRRTEWLPFASGPLPLAYPYVLFGARRIWVIGYSGLYGQSPTNAGIWEKVTAFPDTGFGASLATDEEAFLVFSGGATGRAGCALYSAGKWRWVHGEFSHPFFGSHKGVVYLSGRNGVFIRRQPGTLDFDFLQVPGDAYVNISVDDRSGALWLGSSDGTFRYQPSRTPPHTIAEASASEVRQGAPLPVSFRARARFEPPAAPASFRYSWRVDNEPWSGFQPWPGESLSLPKLHPGRHLLEVRARDADDNVDPIPARVKFAILAEPWQSQIWFEMVAVLLGLLLVWLIWLSISNFRETARANASLRQEISVRRQTEGDLERARGELERRVLERTKQLTRSNENLIHEVAERQQAEKLKFQMEEQLHQSQKMEAVGTLAGGIAHDFNNILAVIVPYCVMVMEELPNRPDLQDHLRHVLNAADRAKNLVQQILTFSRRRHLQRKVCDLLPIVKEVLQLLRSVLPSTIAMSQKINPVHPVLADPTQIHQVIMNLAINAQHAMAGRQGVLEVGLDEILADAGLCERNPDLRPGLYVRISVRDNGCGISPENLKRIFDPFFTTRDAGKGTGLGLAVVHGIVQNHQGAILVESELGKGAVFHVLLPAQTESVDSVPPTVPMPPPSHGEHILLVDDEREIIEVLRRVLARTGYKVSAHSNPREALDDFIARPADIDFVLTDLTMPGMSGLELAKRIYELRPDLPLVITTGFGGDLITPAQLAELPNIRRVVDKPLSSESIMRLIAELLRPGTPGGPDKA